MTTLFDKLYRDQFETVYTAFSYMVNQLEKSHSDYQNAARSFRWAMVSVKPDDVSYESFAQAMIEYCIVRKAGVYELSLVKLIPVPED